MPKEETIELRHIRGVIGEKEDLPIVNTRSTLMSKVKSLLLKTSGTVNVTNSYGSAESADLVTTTTIPGSIKTDGTNLYVGATPFAGVIPPAIIDKIDLDTYTICATLDLSTYGVSRIFGCEIVGKYLYAVTYTSPSKIVKINLESFTVDTILTLTQNLGTSIISDGTDIYIGHLTTSTIITKVNIETFTETTTLDTLVGEGTYSLQLDNIYLYVTQLSNPTRVTRVKLSVFAVDSTISFAGISAWGMNSYIHGNYLYVSAFAAKIHKIDLNTFTLVTTITTSTNYVNGSTLGIDGTYLISAGTPDTALPNITYIDLATFTEYGIYDLPANNNIWSFSLDGSFLYFGLSDGTVYRKYIQPTTQIDSRIVNNINTNVDTANTDIAIIKGDTQTIEDATLKAAPTAGSLSRFVASGGTALGTQLPDSKSLYDTIVLDRLAGSETVSSYDLPNDLVENTAIEITTTTRQRLASVWLDFINLVQNVTIKVYHKIDGTNYRQYDTYYWTTGDEDGILITDVTINNDWKLTITSDVIQGGIKAIPYNIIKTVME